MADYTNTKAVLRRVAGGCACPSSFMGEFCENRIFLSPHCLSKPCKNGGTCYHKAPDSYTCSCPKGFSGATCEVDDDECASNPCRNGGTCVDLPAGRYSCKCPSGYRGRTCEMNIDECRENREICSKFGQCFDRYGGYSCVCDGSHRGKNCESVYHRCSLNPCRNGGTCSSSSSGDYQCECHPHFTGRKCEISTLDCLNGTRRCDEPNTRCDVKSRSCECAFGYIGAAPNCHRMKSCADNPCRNNGVCEDLGNNQYTCFCQSPVKGKHCEITPGVCNDEVCSNGGTCVDQSGLATCSCPPGFSGPLCEINIDDCLTNPCAHGGTCMDLVNDFMCVCLQNFTGKLCENQVYSSFRKPHVYNGGVSCNSPTTPCHNGGNCVVHEGSAATCVCPPTFSGDYCETPKECSINKCHNGGKCFLSSVDKSLEEGGAFRCECLDGYSGEHCEVEYDACAINPCENSGHCTTVKPSKDFKCVCPDGYTGDRCQTNIDDCFGKVCPDGQQCVDLVGSYKCECPHGFDGEGCSRNINECDGIICHNEGVCEDGIGNFTCSCKQGFTGRFCENDIDECQEPNICMHGSICKNEVGGYMCFCRPGYTGNHCEKDVNECYNAQCLNGGVCQDGVNNYTCVCAPGFSGSHCEFDIDECQSKPCQNGATCSDKINRYECACLPGFSGKDCEINIDECASTPCLNNASCTDLINGYTCDCTDTGFMGLHCETNIDDCESNPCQNGAICRDSVKDYQCECYLGYDGKNCENDIPDCLSTTCQNGGTCLEYSNQSIYTPFFPGTTDKKFSYENAAGYVCRCPLGFRGHNCEVNIDDCENHQCVNGVCKDGINKYTCECHMGFQGEFCADQIDECNLYEPCQNGATCVDKVADYECSCPYGYGDKNCSTVLLGCNNHKCINNAKCEPLFNNGLHEYRCHCPIGFYGRHCDILTTVSFVPESSWKLHFKPEPYLTLNISFRTTLKNARLATVLSNNDPYIFIGLHDGRLAVKSGYFSGFLFQETLNDAEWQSVFVNLTSDSQLVVNDGKTEKTLTIGALPGLMDTVLMGLTDIYYPEMAMHFVGCLQGIHVNGELMVPRNQMAVMQRVSQRCQRTPQCAPDICKNGGVCLDMWLNYTCDCSRPFYGAHCELTYPAATYGHQKSISWTKLNISRVQSKEIEKDLDISFFFKTRKENGLIFFIGTDPTAQAHMTESLSTDNTSFIAGLLDSGKFKVVLKVINNAQHYSLIASSKRLDDGNRHFVKIERKSSTLTVTLDKSKQNTTVSDLPLYVSQMYLGWMPTHAPSEETAQVAAGAPINSNSPSNPFVPIAPPNSVSTFDSPSNGNSFSYPSSSSSPFRPNSPFSVPSNFSPNILPSSPSSNTPTSPGLVHRLPPAFQIPLSEPPPFKNSPSVSDVLSVNNIPSRSPPTSPFSVQQPNIPSVSSSTPEVHLSRSKRQMTSTFSGSVADSFGNVANFKGILQDFRVNGKSVDFTTATNEHPILESGIYGKLDDAQNVRDGEQGDPVCKINPCHNGGTCHDEFNSFRCQCTDPYRGARCDEKKPCFIHKCPKFSMCRDLEVGFECVATASFNGSSNALEYVTKFDDKLKTPVLLNVSFTYRTISNGTLLRVTDGTNHLNIAIENDAIKAELKMGAYAIETLFFGENATDGQWHNVSMVLNATNFYGRNDQIEKIQERTTSIVNPINELLSMQTSSVFVAGRRNSPDTYFKGALREVRIGGILLAFFREEQLADSTSPYKFELVSPEGPRIGLTLCWPTDCLNSGQCVEPSNSFECSCNKGFKGFRCETNINECKEWNETMHGPVCYNGGQCHDSIGAFACHCTRGFTGHRCQERIQYCASSPCKNGGVCEDTEPGEYRCKCSEDFLGHHCEERKLIECSAKPCQHRGKCVAKMREGNKAYTCECRPGYEGYDCEIKKDFCKASPCMNNATCYSDNEAATFQCVCQHGYTGHSCQHEIDYCVSQPCLHNGLCIKKVGSFKCDCSHTGYTSEICEKDVDECSGRNPCENGARCVNTEGSFYCQCGDAYFGQHCQYNNTCVLDPSVCANGAFCKPNEAVSKKFECICASGFSGEFCEMELGAITGADLRFVLGLSAACVILLCFIIVAVMFLRVARKKRATRGTYSPSRQEMFGSRVEMNHVMKPPPEERLI